MKQEMAAHQPQTSKSCLTKEEVKHPKEDFFAGNDKSCRYGRFTMGGGKIDIQMECTPERTQATNMAGSYTPTTYSMDMSSHGSGGASGGNMTMKMHVDAQRIGECTGKDRLRPLVRWRRVARVPS